MVKYHQKRRRYVYIYLCEYIKVCVYIRIQQSVLMFPFLLTSVYDLCHLSESFKFQQGKIILL